MAIFKSSVNDARKHLMQPNQYSLDNDQWFGTWDIALCAVYVQNLLTLIDAQIMSKPNSPRGLSLVSNVHIFFGLFGNVKI
jgi:hypothetical protein